MKSLYPPLRLALLYLVVSAIWILISDALVERLAGSNQNYLQQAQHYKGLLFVASCSLLLYYISKKFYTGIKQSLEKSEEALNKYSALSEATKEGIADYNLQTDVAIINAQLKEFLGLQTFEVASFSRFIKQRIHPDDWNRIIYSFRSTIESSHATWQAECRLLWKDGIYHDVIVSGYVMRDKKTDTAMRFICAFQDVSELRNMQAAFYKKQLEQKQSLGITIIKTQEEERNRWALELHDNICQVLTVSKLYLDELAIINPDKRLAKTREMIDYSLNEIRQLSASLKPPSFDDTSLQEAIEELKATILQVRHFTFAVDDKNLNEHLLNDDHKLMLYRIIQEGLTNITKYAVATSIAIELSNTEKEVAFKITDNGKGFDENKIRTGIGLKNIQNRLNAFNGRIELKTAPGKGCTLAGTFEL